MSENAALRERLEKALRPIEKSAAFSREHSARSPSSHQEFIRQDEDNLREYEVVKAEVLAFLDAAPRVEGWQPIATAPKDGTLVLLGNASDSEWPLRCRRWEAGHWRGQDSDDATHWMPLPAPPRETGA